MGVEFYVVVEGASQGKFKGESAKADRKGQIEGFGFTYEVKVPTTAAGVAGKRVHSLSFTKLWGATSPQFLQALYGNESLTVAHFEFVEISAGGERVVQTVNLTGARVQRVLQTVATDVAIDQPLIEEIVLTFTKIEVANPSGHTQATDQLIL